MDEKLARIRREEVFGDYTVRWSAGRNKFELVRCVPGFGDLFLSCNKFKTALIVTARKLSGIKQPQITPRISGA